MLYVDSHGLLRGSGLTGQRLGSESLLMVGSETPARAGNPPHLPRRLSSLRALREAVGATVITGPLGASFWRLLPATVNIRVEPDGYYDQAPRIEDPLKWALLGLGVPTPTATALCRRDPTPRHGYYRHYQRAQRLVSQLEATAPAFTVSNAPGEVPIVDAQGAREYLRGVPQFSWDTETDPDGNLVGLSLCKPGASPVYLAEAEANCFAEPFVSLYLTAIPSVAHNAKWDIKVLARATGRTPGSVALDPAMLSDTMVMAWLVQDHVREKHRSLGLKALTEHYFHDKPLDFKAVCPSGNFRDVPLDLAARYSGADAANTLALLPVMEAKLDTDDLRTLWETIERPLIPILADMEWRGFPVDLEWFARMAEDFERSLKITRERMPFDPAKDEQARQYFYDTLGRAPPHYTPTMKRSVDEEALRSLKHPVASLLLAYRQRAKLLSTFLLPILSEGRPTIHTTFNQCARDDLGENAAPATGRLASSDPDIQNLPLLIREGFIAPEGALIYANDFSQLELRIMAAVSQDMGMLEAFRAGRDIHTELAARIWGIDLNAVSTDQRKQAKNVQFAMQYLASPPKIAEMTGVSLGEARKLLEAVHRARPGAMEWTARCVASAREHGYVQTIMGRRRWVPNINSGWPEARARAEREAVNAVIQGSAADVTKLGMIRVEFVHRHYNGGAMLNQVHDEIVGYVRSRKDAEFLAEVMAREHGGVQFTAKVGMGKNWLETKGEK